MDQALILNLENNPIRFTPDGRVSVVDAIRAVSNVRCPGDLWESLKAEHPEILPFCEEYLFLGEGSVSVVTSEGWEKIWALLPDYLSDRYR
jgi:hypothetical protein